jgi:hypothetical protein
MPLVASIALVAESGSVYVTKPKPRDRPVYGKGISIMSESEACKRISRLPYDPGQWSPCPMYHVCHRYLRDHFRECEDSTRKHQ